MAVSVRMDPALEQELESAAKRQGITKSQFIVDAVERALGRKDPYRLLLKVQRAYGLGPGTAAPALAAFELASPAPMRQRLQAKLKDKQDASMRDWLAYQAARKRGETWQPDVDPPKAKP